MRRFLSEVSGGASCSLEGTQSYSRSPRSVICTFKMKARLLSASMAAGMEVGAAAKGHIVVRGAINSARQLDPAHL